MGGHSIGFCAWLPPHMLPTLISRSAVRLGKAKQQALRHRAFCAVVEAAPRKAGTGKAGAGIASRLRSFGVGFTVAGILSAYALYFKVEWANEELSAMMREVMHRQAQIERRLAVLERQRMATQGRAGGSGG